MRRDGAVVFTNLMSKQKSRIVNTYRTPDGYGSEDHNRGHLCCGGHLHPVSGDVRDGAETRSANCKAARFGPTNRRLTGSASSAFSNQKKSLMPPDGAIIFRRPDRQARPAADRVPSGRYHLARWMRGVRLYAAFGPSRSLASTGLSTCANVWHAGHSKLVSSNSSPRTG